MNRLQVQLGFVLTLLGTTGDALAETVVAFLLQTLAVAAVVGTCLAVWGFRKASAVSSRQALAAGLPTPPA
jgi:hypothetical protein